MSLPDDQPAFQLERTHLAWQRTGLGLLGTAALLTHTGPLWSWVATALLGVLVLVGRQLLPARAMAGVLAVGVLGVAVLGAVIAVSR